MQAKDLWAGTHYAYAGHLYSVPRGESYIPGCKRVMVIRTKQEKDFYAERASTKALVEFDGGRQEWVRGRDILDFWDHYEAEKLRREQEANERKKVQEREALVQEARVNRAKSILYNALIERGVPPNLVGNLLRLDYGGQNLSINITKLEAALELPPIQLTEDRDGISDKEAAIRAIAANFKD